MNKCLDPMLSFLGVIITTILWIGIVIYFNSVFTADIAQYYSTISSFVSVVIIVLLIIQLQINVNNESRAKKRK